MLPMSLFNNLFHFVAFFESLLFGGFVSLYAKLAVRANILVNISDIINNGT